MKIITKNNSNYLVFTQGKKEKVLDIYNLDNRLNLYDSDISCGICQVTGINFFTGSLSRFCSNNKIQANKVKDVFKCIFSFYVKKQLKSGDDKACMLIASTNLSNNTYKKMIESSLGELSSIKSRARKNGNSGNKIRLWVIPVKNL